MALAPRLDLRQSQSLVMTPQLQQAIKLLTLSNLELETFISDEIEKNPLLDTGEISTESGEASDGENGPVEAAAQGSDEILSSGPAESESTLDMQGDTDSFSNNGLSDSDGALDGQLGLNGASAGASGTGDAPDFENMLVA